MKKLLFLCMLAAINLSAMANTETEVSEDEFATEEKIETGLLYNMIAGNTSTQAEKADEKVEYGSKVTKWASTPKFGGYVIGKYAYSSDDATNQKQGFQQRLARVYVDGKILNDFTYRIQVQFNNASPHMKDYFIEWGKFKEVKLKMGQFKRAFGFENPMNPWDVGVGEYSQLSRNICGVGTDYDGAASSGGRDQIFQVQGDLFPIGADKHRLLHYQLQVANGQGINCTDANSKKDVIGTLQFQPVKNLFVGAFGWKGNYTNGTVTVDRKRWAVGAKYDIDGWMFRTEYAQAKGHKLADYDADANTWKGTGKADAFYFAATIPVIEDWFKLNLRYDMYRDQANSDKMKTYYSVCPTFRLHKNLMFQLQYNYVTDKKSKDNTVKSHELWVETYFRF